MEFIKNQYWRYATKKFNPEKKVSTEYLELLKKGVQLSVSSYGLQLYKVLIVENEEIRKQLKAVSWDQPQITDASHLFVFCNYERVESHHIDEYLSYTAVSRQLAISDLQSYGDRMKRKIAEKSFDEQFHWTKHQTYIALANLLSACAELRIDACPMEGFDSEAYNKILGLSGRGLNASVMVAIGYRSQEDKTQNLHKIRKPSELLFEIM